MDIPGEWNITAYHNKHRANGQIIGKNFHSNTNNKIFFERKNYQEVVNR